jgi:hypothetical protein
LTCKHFYPILRLLKIIFLSQCSLKLYERTGVIEIPFKDKSFLQ